MVYGRLIAALIAALAAFVYGQADASDLGRVVQLKPAASAAVDTGDVLHGKVDATVRNAGGLRAALGFDYVAEPGKDFVLKVTGVTPGSPAYNSGLKVGDRIVDVSSTHEGTDIEVERAGKRYKTTVKPQSDALSGGLAVGGGGKFRNDPRLKSLARYSLVILIDKSGSMHTPDCPGSLSRWTWCGQETMEVTDALASKFGSDITLVPFCSDYTIYEHCGIKKLAEIFQLEHPGGGTSPEFALGDVFNTYFQRVKERRETRPLMVVIVTDGIPNDVWAVADTITSATRRMAGKDQVRVVFLQVADDLFARDILADYDRALVPNGARFDIVDYEVFQDVIQRGILGSLLDSVSGRSGSSHYVAQGGALARYSHERSGAHGHRLRNALSERQGLEDTLIKKYSSP